MARLLLINPRSPESFWSFKWAVDNILPHKRAINPPLGLATLAALCPQHWQVTLIDENVEPVPLRPAADLIGICGMGIQFARQAAWLTFFRARGYFVVAGGSYASLCPERYEALADAVVAGEAEYIWPRLCADFERGAPARLYRETGSVRLEDSPTPRFDLLKLPLYSTATLQFSRGCPYRCEFCDIIVMFGRKPRTKRLAQVARELDALRAHAVHNVFFVDDNLIGDKGAALALLRFLCTYQEAHGFPFSFGTEVSLNLAQDEELLALFRRAHFAWVFIGIETPDATSLKEAHKTQNLREDMLQSVRRIFSYGIDVLAGFIVGFDNDTPETFERQYRFIVNAGIQAAMVGLLTALPRTPLYARLEKEHRLNPEVDAADNTRPATNVIPAGMSYEALIAGYLSLYRRLTTDAAIAERIRNKLRFFAPPAARADYGARQRIGIAVRLLTRGLLPGGLRRIRAVLASMPLNAPGKWPLALLDWSAGLAMRDYVERHFPSADVPRRRLDRFVESLTAAAARYVREGGLGLALAQGECPNLLVELKGFLDARFFARAARPLKRLLKNTRSTVTLHVGELQARQTAAFQRLLARLACYGDRIFIIVDERLRDRIEIDSSVFNLVLDPHVP
ncbi:MAG: radical SAM protein [Betaproteobacteria bacterium]|nr:radical SAM protein [Betaproteobacteria bacterium]